MIDRTQQPPILPIDKIDFSKPKVFDMGAKTKLFSITSVPNETARFDLYFDAGTIQGKSALASLTNGLLLSGTATKTSQEINEAMNSLGGYMESGISNENAVFSIYSLRENTLELARIVFDAINNCNFREDEVSELIADRKQRFKVDLEKVSVIAQRALKQRLFSNSVPYSQIGYLTDYDVVSRAELIKFHNDFYLNGLTRCVLVGNFPQDDIDAFMDIFGKWNVAKQSIVEKSFINLKGAAHIEKEGALQTAIRVARPLFNKTHEDYIDFLVLQTILGDYFGSRLMSNIREDKGYTYGIGCIVSELKETGYFMIATEVGREARDATLKEIKFEMERLQTELVSAEELSLVKNYLLGQLLKSADGAYAMMDLFLSVEAQNLGLDFYNKSIERINEIDSERLMELAKKYLNWDDYTIVSAG